MKKQVELRPVKKRMKALFEGMPIKTVAKPFVELVEELGFIDVKTDKQTMSAEEKVLLIIYQDIGRYKDIANFKGLDEIQIIHKNYVHMRYGADYYTVSIKDGPEVRVGFDEWNGLKAETKSIRRWA